MIGRARCPQCIGPVYVPDDSHSERIECEGCGAELVTRRDLAGDVTLELAPEPDMPAVETDHAREIAALRDLSAEHEPTPDWQKRVWGEVDKPKEPK